MSFEIDEGIKEKLNVLIEEVKQKRDACPPQSEEKKYYRKISKHLDSTLKVLNEIKNKDHSL